MAEILIPVVALAGAAVLSSMDKKKDLNITRENFVGQMSQMQAPESSLDNTVPITNTNTNRNTNIPSSQSVSIQGQDTKVYTDKYVAKNNNYQAMNNNNNNDYSRIQLGLTGEPIDRANFRHNNMQPFFGGKIKGAGPNADVNESILDNMQGAGSQHFKKDEIAPLFKPEENMSWQNGAPNNTDFYMSRMNAPTAMNNVTLWDQQRVAPGLNQGYTTDGTGGFNAGLNGRDLHRPRNVDELRVDNNPRQTFEYKNPQGPATSGVKNPGFLGRVEKKLPEKYFASGPDRWFTTTGNEIKPTNRSVILMSEENRETTSTDYFGGGNNTGAEGTYTEQNFRDTHRQQLDGLPITNVNAGDKYSPDKNNFGVDGYKTLANNRCTTQHTLPLGGVSGVVSSIMAPINDMLRPSRKENAVGNIRIMGSINNKESQGSYVTNKNDRPRTTIRDMTGDRIDLNHVNVQNQRSDGYLSTGMVPIQNQRDSTSISYTGGGNSQAPGMRNTNGKQLRVDNVNKSYESRPTIGSTNRFMGSINAVTNRNESDRNNNRMWVPANMPANIPSREFMGESQSTPFSYPEQCNNRLDDSLLTAFKNNPYTQSLHSAA